MNEIRNILIGFQLGRDKSQICYYDRKSQEPLSIPTKVGSALYDFPTALCKMEGKEEWHFGLEAEYFGQQPGGILVEQLYEICGQKEAQMIDRRLMEPWELLEIFFKEALRMLGVHDVVKGVSSLMITCDKLTKVFVGHVRRALEHMGFDRDTYHIQDYDESFYYYTMYQKPEIRLRKVALYHFMGQSVYYQELSIDRKTRPALVRLSQPKQYELTPVPERWDEDFSRAIVDTMGAEAFSSVFIIGEEFKKEWAVKSLQVLARNKKHIFYGNNLYVKGACYGAKEKAEEKKLKEFLFMGKDLVRSNVGMEMIVRGMKVYYPLVVAGVNWYEACQTCEFILDDMTELNFLVSPMSGGEKKIYAMQLTDLPARPNRTTRLRLEVECEAPNQCHIQVTDLGFGEMYPATGQNWTDTMEL